LHLHDHKVKKRHDWNVLEEPGVLREDLRDPQPGFERDQDIDFDTARLPLEARKTTEEHLVSCSRLFRVLEVIAIICLYDAPLDLFRVKLFGPITCNEDINILGMVSIQNR